MASDRDRVNAVLDELARCQAELATLRAYTEMLEHFFQAELAADEGGR
jgi:hypothetical protein